MTGPDLAKLRNLAAAATPGPWETVNNAPEGGTGGAWEVWTPDGALHLTVHPSSRAPYEQAAFIAAADPATVLALLDKADRYDQWKEQGFADLDVELEHERDEWKARAEAAEADADRLAAQIRAWGYASSALAAHDARRRGQ